MLSAEDVVNPFLEADARLEMQNLIEKTVPCEGCTVDEFLNGDDNLPVCWDMDDDNLNRMSKNSRMKIFMEMKIFQIKEPYQN